MRVSDQHLLNGFYCVDADVTRKDVEPLNDLFIELLGCSFLKRKRAAYHSIEDDSQGPNVSNKSIVSLTCNHLRRRIARTSTSSREQPPIHHIIRQSKIYHLDVVIRIQKYVLRFEVTMRNVQPMKVLNGIEDLIEDLACCLFLQSNLIRHYAE